MIPHVVGVGRVCIDHYLAPPVSADRFDGSAKRSCGELLVAVGGSVPRILAAACATRAVSCQFIGGARPADAPWIQGELDRLYLPAVLVETETTAHSFIEFGVDGSLESITSAEPPWTLSVPPDALDDTRQHPAVLLTDGRLNSRLLPMLERMNRTGGPRTALWLDPGTTWKSSAGRRAGAMLAARHAQVIIASTDFFEAIESAGLMTPSDAIHIETRQDGSVVGVAPCGRAEVTPAPVKLRGTSLGAGDIFRGHVLAHLAKRDSTTVDRPLLRSVLGASLKASAWRLADDSLEPRCPGLAVPLAVLPRD